ncbi:hypothetical protein BSZ39_10150 [Bowdeniella nasicola]|uniref:Uncharacterized protein n=1 Tax=Bowdeniella nasicola TaxID=208480 RepID=A0A1Q5Q166_9ACTO|nr:hypothetical protein [Bowdeniella nasicola]OKL53330.1 hypothetical protein BSZ39_10150 [Bowdeniella nasicola]
MDTSERLAAAFAATEHLAERLPLGLTPYYAEDGDVIAGAWPDTHPIPWPIAFWVGQLRVVEVKSLVVV